jgi:Rrf2 family transcriptional regulator, cysteine metabolism repressor
MNLISTKGVYCLAALYELSKQPPGDYVQIKDIAEKQNIPQNYLEQLLTLLKKGGFVKSLRGAKGGYRLALQPAQIGIFDILERVEGPLTSVEPYGKSKILKRFWKNAHDKIRLVFGETLEDLLTEEKKLQGQMTYHI